MRRFPPTRRFACPYVVTLLATAALGTVGYGQDAPHKSDTEGARRRELELLVREELDRRDRRELDEFARHVEDVAKAVDALETARSMHTTHLQELLTNNDGKRLAQDQASAWQIVGMYDRPIVTAETLEAKKASITSMLEGVRGQIKHPSVGYRPSDEQKREVDEILFWTNGCSAGLAEQQSWLSATLERLPKDADLKGAKTLETCIRDYRARWLEMWAKAVLVADEQTSSQREQILVDAEKLANLELAKLEAEKRLAEQRAENARERARLLAELAKKDEETKQIELDAKRREADLELKHQAELAAIERKKNEAVATQRAEDVNSQLRVDEIKKDADRKLLVQRCHSPEVAGLLAPFLAKGYAQPPNLQEQQVDLVPVSFSRLKAFGALDPSLDGVSKLLLVGTHWLDKVRPRWPYNPNFHVLKPNEIEDVKKAQALLRELGPTMVEEGMLAP